MGRMQIIVSDGLEKRFRKKVVRKFGFKKGSISDAIEEAITEWLKAK